MAEFWLQDKCVKFAKGRGALARKMKYEARKGCHDYWFVGFGFELRVEFKSEDGEESAHQSRERKRLAERGITIHIIDDYEDFKEIYLKHEKAVATS